MDPRAELHVLGDHGLRFAIVDRRRAQGVGALLARVEDHLGDLGPEHRAGVIEQRDERGVQLRRVLQDPARLVEQLELLVLLAFRQVRPVGEEDRHERDQQEQDGARVDPHDRDREQGEARVRQRHDQPELEHLGQLLELRRPARQRDRAWRSSAHRSRPRRASPRRRPPSRRRPAVRSSGAMRWNTARVTTAMSAKFARLNATLTIDWRAVTSSAIARSREDREHVFVGRHEEQPDDGRDLAQRERMRLAAEVDEDDLRLRQEAGEREHRPRDVDRTLHRLEVAHVEEVAGQREGRHERREQPHPCRGRAQGTADDHPADALLRVRLKRWCGPVRPGQVWWGTPSRLEAPRGNRVVVLLYASRGSDGRAPMVPAGVVLPGYRLPSADRRHPFAATLSRP